MTDVANILLSTTTLLSTNISVNEVIAIIDGNITTVSTSVDAPLPIWAGFIGCLVATFFYGSNLVPVKQFSAGDGFFFQFIFCVAVYIVGLIVDLILNNHRFYPLVVIGGIRKFIFIFKYIRVFLGVLWSTGNLVIIICIKTCGLGVGMLIWGTSNLLMGWASGRFGVLGIKAQVPRTTTKLVLNYSSVVLAATSAIFFIFIKPTHTPRKPHYAATNGGTKHDDSVKKEAITIEDGRILETDFPFLNRLSDPVQKGLGCALAVVAGAFYGTMFIPDQYIRDHREKFTYKNDIPPNNGLYYISSQYSGILLSSFFHFIIYATLKRNKPSINPSIALPAMASGIMWAIANIGFIVAISALKSAVAYPIVSVLPGVVTSLWSLFWFREIQGRRNYIFLACGMFGRCLAALLSGLSA
jgi:hypothetical protein